MTQNREPPAYQEFAASILSALPFRAANLQDRGLLYTLRLELWVNRRLPKNPNELAKVLRLPLAEVIASLPNVMPFFALEAESIFSPELENYRAYLDERRTKQSEGGKRGAGITNVKRNRPVRPVAKGIASNPQLPRRGEVDSLVQYSTAQPSQNQSLKREELHDFVSALESTPMCIAEDYAKASGG